MPRSRRRMCGPRPRAVGEAERGNPAFRAHPLRNAQRRPRPARACSDRGLPRAHDASRRAQERARPPSAWSALAHRASTRAPDASTGAHSPSAPPPGTRIRSSRPGTRHDHCAGACSRCGRAHFESCAARSRSAGCCFHHGDTSSHAEREARTPAADFFAQPGRSRAPRRAAIPAVCHEPGSIPDPKRAK
jgi:hypothetical protein